MHQCNPYNNLISFADLYIFGLKNNSIEGFKLLK